MTEFFSFGPKFHGCFCFCSGGIEVDKAKVDAIEKMSCPKDIKGIRSFLGHAGFYTDSWPLPSSPPLYTEA